MSASLPLIAIVGRPNVGKSTLFNRLIGQRRSIVTDEPGITRDRIYGIVSWHGRSYEVVDTGGIIPGEESEIPVRIFEQAQIALESASLIFLVVDGRTSITASDHELARLLRRTAKPVFIVVNKIDSEKQAADASEFYRLGIDRVFPVSAEHGRGITELLDEVAISIPAPQDTEEVGPVEIRVAIIGRPNVGKSTLLNKVVGQERAMVSPIAGTTRDAVDSVIQHDGLTFRFVDTAGIRRKGKTELKAEKLSVVMARRHLERQSLVESTSLKALPSVGHAIRLETNMAHPMSSDRCWAHLFRSNRRGRPTAGPLWHRASPGFRQEQMTNSSS